MVARPSMSAPASRIEALRAMKKELAAFLSGDRDVREFVPRFGALFAPFDCGDEEEEGLSPAEIAQLRAFWHIAGSAFGESESFIPRRASWKYGDPVLYGWIDTDAYRAAIVHELRSRGITL